MKKHHKHAMDHMHESHKKSHHVGKHHSDPMVGGESEAEGRRIGAGDFAGMPTEVKMKMYPKASEYGPEVLDDTMGHVDKTNSMAHKKSRSHVSNQH